MGHFDKLSAALPKPALSLSKGSNNPRPALK
jgi:hypothetical protein